LRSTTASPAATAGDGLLPDPSVLRPSLNGHGRGNGAGTAYRPAVNGVGAVAASGSGTGRQAPTTTDSSASSSSGGSQAPTAGSGSSGSSSNGAAAPSAGAGPHAWPLTGSGANLAPEVVRTTDLSGAAPGAPAEGGPAAPPAAGAAAAAQGAPDGGGDNASGGVLRRRRTAPAVNADAGDVAGELGAGSGGDPRGGGGGAPEAGVGAAAAAATPPARKRPSGARPRAAAAPMSPASLAAAGTEPAASSGGGGAAAVASVEPALPRTGGDGVLHAAGAAPEQPAAGATSIPSAAAGSDPTPAPAARASAQRPHHARLRTVTRPLPRVLFLHTGGTLGMDPEVNSAAYQAFDSLSYPYLATLGIDVDWNTRMLLRVEGAYKPRFKLDPRVIRVPVVPGSDPRTAYGDLYGRGVRGVVLEAFGVGNLPDQASFGWLPWLRDQTAKGLQVCLASQCSVGPLQPSLYRAGQLAEAMGVEAGPAMTPECAAVKLMFCLKHPDLALGVPLAGEL
ncbi:Glutamyl-tRNA(Gln) amidotransferase subunit D, partial [Tetrabaena socialis]